MGARAVGALSPGISLTKPLPAVKRGEAMGATAGCRQTREVAGVCVVQQTGPATSEAWGRGACHLDDGDTRALAVRAAYTQDSDPLCG